MHGETLKDFREVFLFVSEYQLMVFI